MIKHCVDSLLFFLISAPCWQLDVIGIDEAQFFEDLYDFCSTIADRDRKIVVVAGLDGDYLRCFSIISKSSPYFWISQNLSVTLLPFPFVASQPCTDLD